MPIPQNHMTYKCHMLKNACNYKVVIMGGIEEALVPSPCCLQSFYPDCLVYFLSVALEFSTSPTTSLESDLKSMQRKHSPMRHLILYDKIMCIYKYNAISYSHLLLFISSADVQCQSSSLSCLLKEELT